jgi:hypothetical protein
MDVIAGTFGVLISNELFSSFNQNMVYSSTADSTNTPIQYIPLNLMLNMFGV